MDVRAAIKRIHSQVEANHSKLGTPPVLHAFSGGLSSSREAAADLEDLLYVVGQLPPQPETVRGRIGAILVRAVQRLLFWYTPQIHRFHEQTTRVAKELCLVAEHQARLIAELQTSIRTLRRDSVLTSISSQPSAGDISPDFLYDLQDHFRGTEADTLAKLGVWLETLEEKVPPHVLSGEWVDLGCGRGEWLTLTTERGYKAVGIDTNSLSVELCRERGFDVHRSDAIRYLESVEDESLSVVTAFQVVEHLPFSYVVQLVATCQRKLRIGGVLLLETPDPENLQMAAHHFWLDPSHGRPIPSPLMKWLFDYLGLNVISHLRLNPAPADEHLAYTEIQPVYRVNQFLFGPRDYGILGRREG